ncbi:type III secretion protein [Pseudomonas sp. F8002]|uniref:type III secretion protein n=1 Tax=Pseudomonas sp. F8002 TaxID=2738822 RepID=UPI0015A12F27|nr:type III secretion protein [Pseudomonas sp. F8002]NWB56971.1 type III secretion protein [Pseudomonas sp. F8002]
MSVTLSNSTVANPSDNAAQRNTDAATLTQSRSRSGQGSIHISFNVPQNGVGPVYSNGPTTQSPMDTRGAANHAFPASYPNSFLGGLIGQLQDFLHKLFNQFRPQPGYGRPDPAIPLRPLPGHCRPTPGKPDPGYGRPDPQYSSRTNDQLGDLLKNNFDAFKAPGKSYVTKQSLEDMAGRRLTGNEARDQNILLAQELLRRPEVIQAFDRAGGTGDLDGRISRKDLDAVLDSGNNLKYKTDKQLAEQMLEKFNALKGGFWKSSISIKDLKSLAESQLTGNPKRDEIIELAREVTQRSSLLTLMDALDRRYDGKIGKDALRWLSR